MTNPNKIVKKILGKDIYSKNSKIYYTSGQSYLENSMKQAIINGGGKILNITKGADSHGSEVATFKIQGNMKQVENSLNKAMKGKSEGYGGIYW